MRLAGAALLFLIACAPARAPDRASFVITHAHLFSVLPGDAVMVTGERITAVGPSEALAAECACPLIDAAGGFVMPGFHDAHAHPFSAGIAASQLPVRSASIPAIEEAVRAYAAAHPAEPWILGRGWLSARFETLPTAKDLDAAEPTRPVVLTDSSGHNLWVNSAALAAAGITEATPDPPGGRIHHPLGVLLDAAQVLIGAKEPPLTDEAIAVAIERAQDDLLAVGITSTAESGTEPLRVAKMYAKLDREGKLRMRVFLWAPIAGDLRAWIEFAHSLPREGKVHVAAFKAFADGTMVAHTAALIEPYADTPDTSGNLYYPQATLNARLVKVNEAGFPVAIHAIGDRAVRQALDAFEHSKNTLHHSLVNRVEHVNVVDPSDLPRFGQLAVAASVQPVWQFGYPSLAAFPYRPRLGLAREPSIYAWRSLATSGATLLFGSDVPSSTICDPISGLYSAITRKVANGEMFLPAEALDRETALRAYTENTPRVMGWGDRLGRIAPGQFADLLWLDHDPTTGAMSIAEDPIKGLWVAGARLR